MTVPLAGTTGRRLDETAAVRAGLELEDAPALEVMRWALDTFHPRLAIASSMGDAVLIHLASRITDGVPVVWLDTGYHFAETRGMADAVEATYPVRLHRVLPLLSVPEQDAQHGARLHDRDPDACCRMRKVEPLERALAGYDAWASGVRREETAARAHAGVVEWDATRGMVKVNPIARWTQADVDAYVEEHGVLVNDLLTDGYASIGCAPCTRRVAPGEDPRAGRWSSSSKTECGLNG